VQSGKYADGAIVVSLSNPSGGKINYLRFERAD